MAKIATGSQVDQVVNFNSGFLTIGSSKMADVSDVTISNGFDAKAYRALNSIKKRALRRATLEQSVSLTMFGIQKAVYESFFSSSSPIATGTQWTVKDGQQDDKVVLLTTYADDDLTKTFQYQLQNPLFGTNNANLPTEDFATTEVEIMCTEIIFITDTAAEN